MGSSLASLAYTITRRRKQCHQLWKCYTYLLVGGNRNTTGDPPLGVDDYAAAVIGNEIFFFGGYCNHYDRNRPCCHNSLYSLNVDTFNWREILPTNRTNPNDGPQMKYNCGMIAVNIGGEDYLVVVGGYPLTNEIHYFRISAGNF